MPGPGGGWVGLVPGVWLWGGLVPRVWLGGVCSRGSGPGGVPGPGGLVVSQYALRLNPPPMDRQTPVKTLPWPNFVAAGGH